MNTDAISHIPSGWFLHHAAHEHTEIVYRGDVHEPLPHAAGPWLVELQKLPGGGLLTVGRGHSLAEAIRAAAAAVYARDGLAPPPLPRRAYQLELKVGADSLKDLIGYLRGFETELHMGKISTGVSGGYSAGSIYSLSVDDSITHDSWAEVNQRYVDWINERDRA